MATLLQPRQRTHSGYRPDGRWEDTVVEVKSGLHSLRNLRAGLLQLAYYLAEKPEARALLVLANSRITDAALENERRLAERTLKPEVLKRLAVAVERNDRVLGVPDDHGEDFHAWLRNLIRQETRAGKPRQASEAIFLVLLHQWLSRQGLMTTDWIMQTVGCSYPTAANALRRLGAVIERSSDRRVNLNSFPEDEWRRVVANAGRARPTIRYVDRSGQQRSPESLLRRASKLGRTDLAVGGVIAARNYHPELDLRGTPRLDLALHSSVGHANLDFVEQLDPALERMDRQDGPVALAVHLVRRRESLFQPSGDGLPWAIPIECVLDLHDARLEPQAREFLDFLVTGVG